MPITTGKKASLPRKKHISVAGIMILHTEAAVITPAAKALITFSDEESLSESRKTEAPPIAVPKKGSKTPGKI